MGSSTDEFPLLAALNLVASDIRGDGEFTCPSSLHTVWLQQNAMHGLLVPVGRLEVLTSYA